MGLLYIPDAGTVRMDNGNEWIAIPRRMERPSFPSPSLPLPSFLWLIGREEAGGACLSGLVSSRFESIESLYWSEADGACLHYEHLRTLRFPSQTPKIHSWNQYLLTGLVRSIHAFPSLTLRSLVPWRRASPLYELRRRSLPRVN